MRPCIYNKKTGVYTLYVDRAESGMGTQDLRDETIDELRERVGVTLAEDEVLLDGDRQIFDVTTGEVKWLLPATPTPGQQMDLDALAEKVSAQEARIAELERQVEESRWSWEAGPPVDKAPEGPPIDNTGDRDGKPPIGEWEVEDGK